MHFFAIYFMIFILSCFWFYPKNQKDNLLINNSNQQIEQEQKVHHNNNKPHLTKYLTSILLIILLILLLNSFWLQGLFSNKIFSAIDTQHEDFFSPKMSKDVSAFAKVLGMYGFWREAGYLTTYKFFSVYIWYIMLFILLILFLTGFYLNNDNKTLSYLFFALFWTGLILATGISHPYTKPFFDFLFNNLPFFNGFRDSHKLVSLIVLAYSYFIPITIINLKEKIKSKKFMFSRIISYFPVALLIIFILLFTFPLLGLWNQVKPIGYPQSYYQVNNYLEKQSVNGNMLYLPFQTYLTYSWSLNSSSDGRISVPINNIVKKTIIIGPDQYGAGDELMKSASICLNEKSISCLENNNVQYVLKDKCAMFPDKYGWINNTLAYSTECIDIYEIDNINNIQETKIPIGFILGSLISLITLIILIYLLYSLKPK